MAEVLVMPQLGNTVESCLITAWRVEVGQPVDPSTVLCEIETDKSAMEVPAGLSGLLLARLAEVGDEVPVKAPLAVIGQPGDDISAWTGAEPPAAVAPTDSEPAAVALPEPIAVAVPEPVPVAVPEALPPPAPAVGSSLPFAPAVGMGQTGPKAASPRARELAAVYGIAIDSLTGSGPRGRVIERDVLAAAAGQGSAAASSLVTPDPAPEPVAPEPLVDDSAPAEPSGPTGTTRAVQTQSQPEAGRPDSGSGIGGRVRLADLIGQTARSQAEPDQPSAPPAPAAPPPPDQPLPPEPVPTSGAISATHPALAGPIDDPSFPGPVDQTVLRGIRQLVAGRMLASLSNHAQLTFDSSAPATNLLNLRARLKRSDPVLGMNGVTIGDLVAYAAVQTARQHAGLNATLADGVLSRYAEVHLGLAVDTPRGLLVPTVRFASRLGLRQFSSQTKDLAAKAQSGSVSPDLLSGATFTVTNLGAFGIESFTPILNSPQVAILGVNAIRPQPTIRPDGGLAVEQRIGFSLTVDHAVVDGADAARFLADLVALVADIDIAVLD
ncbi:MAG: 2-oxo acid dehydrogenase subunit E2 [Propionibacteriaceae bacterium]|jgi:pyruvate dehydrogenase E2 component (dihydrolipoamide acetyltransferase)|nr:2-oxo acid dehydrogenase subunit E2 [Propionibacteriaceae bacterium]